MDANKRFMAMNPTRSSESCSFHEALTEIVTHIITSITPKATEADLAPRGTVPRRPITDPIIVEIQFISMKTLFVDSLPNNQPDDQDA